MNDTEFMNRLHQRDPVAVQYLTDTFVPSLWRYVYFRVNGDQHLAEDIVSESILAMVNYAEKNASIERPSAWLRTVASNKVNDHFRAAARVQHLIDDARETGKYVEEEDAVAKQILVEQRIDVRRAVDRLPEEHRLALEWKYIEKISVNEISIRLGVTEKAAESILFRARRELRSKLTSLDEDEEGGRPSLKQRESTTAQTSPASAAKKNNYSNS